MIKLDGYLKLLVDPGHFRFRKTSTDEDTGFASPQGFRIYSGINDCFVSMLEHHSTHWIHGVGLDEVHIEEICIELFDIVEFSKFLRNFWVI